jgi:hypothetical protein
MADEKTLIEEEKTVVVTPPVNNPFDENSWGSSPTATEVKTELEQVKTEDEEEIIEEDEAYKREFGKTKQEFKAEYEELKKFRDAKPPSSEYKFENEESRKLAVAISKGDKKAVLKILETQDKLDTYLTTEVNKETAADIIKLSIQLKNKELTTDEVEFEYKQNYTIPKEPVQKVTEDDDDFKERHDEWIEKCGIIEQKRIIAAKMAKPELEKLKTEITLPDIQNGVDPKLTEEAQQKELERFDGIRNQYLKVLESEYTKFNGYEVRAKDGEVEIPVAYIVTDQQKAALRDELKDFDVDGFIESRWFNKDGSPNISQMMEDVHLLRNKGDIFQKIANDAASKRLVQHLGDKSKVDVNGKKPEGTFNPNGQQTDMQKVQEFFWNQS